MKYLITSALPYANGPLHFGHLAGAYLPADVYTRHRRLQGHETLHISGSDEHGVAIMMNANKAGQAYKEYVDGWHKDHAELFNQYEVDFDFFGQTSADYHRDEVLKWFHCLHEKGMIEPQDEKQLQCQSCSNFLPDRFVEGECYECGFEKARGDECPSCGTWIDAIKLKKPICQFCKSTDIKVATSKQWYLKMSKYHKEFREWFSKQDHFRKTIIPFVESLSKEELHDRAITRDLDWGIDVPLEEAKGKKLYVWFDAPIGYVSNTKKYLEEKGSSDDYLKDWWKNADTRIVNFIGKDNIIFHTIIFPVMGMASEIINPPYDVAANQYLNLEGKQFSKSTGWYVDAKEAVKKFGPTALRYYLISNAPENTDASFSWDGFEAKVNNELANNIGNLVNRCMKFLHKNFPEGAKGENFVSFFASEQATLWNKEALEVVKGLNEIQIRKALERLMILGQATNTYFSDNAPWAQIKSDKELAEKTLAWTAVQVYLLGLHLSPFLPLLSRKILAFYENLEGIKTDEVYQGNWQSLQSAFGKGWKVPFEPEGLVPKIPKEDIAAMKEALTEKMNG